MNFVRMNVEESNGSIDATRGGHKIRLKEVGGRLRDGQSMSGAVVGRNVVLGVRPEDLSLDDAAPSSARLGEHSGDGETEEDGSAVLPGKAVLPGRVTLSATVILVETLGDSALVHVKVFGNQTTWVCRMDANSTYDRGAPVDVSWDSEQEHWFDGGTGDRLT